MLIDTEGSFDKTDDYNNAVSTVLSCYVCKTYIDEGQKYLPEGPTSIQSEKLDSFFGYPAKFSTAEECYGYFCRDVCL